MCDIRKISKRFKYCDSQLEYMGIKWKGTVLWICEKCWYKLANSEIEW